MTPYAVRHANRGENPELATFIQKMMRLSKLPCDIIFVSDGDNRPHIKRDVRVIMTEARLYKSILLLIEAFGFEHHTVSLFLAFGYVPEANGNCQAPAEAEAELAYMNFSGIIDAVITSDSDVFLFGALKVIRKWVIVPRNPFLFSFLLQLDCQKRG
jgi:Holliday junction resolvase YEN1